ncbi:hypothetical protein ACFLVL_03065 [Chloroflexota bacterium]
MANRLKRWVPTCNRLVAFLDIMGFGNLVVRNEHDLVLNTLKEFAHEVDRVNTAGRRHPRGSVKAQHVAESAPPDWLIKVVYFSDSVLLVSRDDSLESVRQTFVATRWLLAQSWKLKVPIKGAIAYGKQTANFKRSIHFGKPLIDAFELQNQLLLYGVILHHSLERLISDSPKMHYLRKERINKYPAPMKNGNINHYVVVPDDNDLGNNSKLEDVVLALYGMVSGAPRIYVDNTYEFVTWLHKKANKVSE